MRAYYDARAAEYDDWYLGTGLFASRERPGWHEERDALDLPFADGAFDRVLAGHFYGHLEPEEREAFLREAGRVGDEVVVVDSADEDREEWQERKLNDGSRHRVYKRWFSPAGLSGELGGGDVLHAGRWFVVVLAFTPPPPRG